MRRALPFALGLLLLGLGAPVHAQYRTPRSADYLFATTASGARAIWVNPAALGTVFEASVMIEAMVERNGAGDYPLAQYTFGFNSRGVAFGFRRDRFPNDGAGNTWRFGFGRALGRVSIGAAASIYSGTERKQDVDVGIRYLVTRGLDVALGVEHIGQPTVRDSALRFAGTAGIGWRPVAPLTLEVAARGADGAGTQGWLFAYRAGVSLETRGRLALGLRALVDLDDAFHIDRLVAAISIGGPYRGILVGSGAKRAGDTRLETLSVTGVASHDFR
ncbi:MAG: hypothetical protein OER21_00895 [Gemmatimonadota bacterium]|nr:hypothetical protein [Gemmatimonadota bacterium]